MSLPFLLCAIVASLHYSTEAESVSDSRYQLGKALLRRAREINETRSNGDELEDEMSEEERERAIQTDASEDIFVGSGSHVYESQGKSDTSGSRRDETSGDEGRVEEAEEDDNSPTSGDSNEGEKSENDESDDDDEEKSEEDDDDDGTETKQEQENTEDEDTSGSGLIENENAAGRSSDVSGSGSGSELQDDNSDQSGSGESTVEEVTPTSTSEDEASGAQNSENNEVEPAARKSEIETASGDSEDEEDDSGSADVIKKGIESLSRLLTPVASGYEFELYSGNAAKNDKEEESEAEGESEKGVSSDAEEVQVKQCKRVCEEPMTYEQCAVPRCDYKMGSIKDLCIYLCKHQTPVCRQQCE